MILLGDKPYHYKTLITHINHFVHKLHERKCKRPIIAV